MRNVLTIAAAAALGLLTSCGDNSDEPAGSKLTADEAAQLNDAAEMLDASNAPALSANSVAP